MAAQVKRLNPRMRIILLDLPEVNCAQTYYLKGSFPSAKFVYYEDWRKHDRTWLFDADFDFAILPGWSFADFPTECLDYMANIRSFQEMNQATLAYYFQNIQRCLRVGGGFYCVNRYRKHTADVQPILFKEYAFDDRWETVHSAPSPLQPWIHELIARRSATPSAAFVMMLKELPDDHYAK